MIGIILTIILVPVFFGIRIAIQDQIRSIGSDRRRRRRDAKRAPATFEQWMTMMDEENRRR